MSLDLERLRAVQQIEHPEPELVEDDQPVEWWHLPLDLMMGAGFALILVWVGYQVAAWIVSL